MTELVELAVIGLTVLVVIAIAIGIVDRSQEAAWRRIAAERRATWERRQQLLGHRSHVDAWGDEDTD